MGTWGALGGPGPPCSLGAVLTRSMPTGPEMVLKIRKFVGSVTKSGAQVGFGCRRSAPTLPLRGRAAAARARHPAQCRGACADALLLALQKVRKPHPNSPVWVGPAPRDVLTRAKNTDRRRGSKAAARPSREFTGQTGGAANREKAGWALSREPGAGGAGLGSGRRTSWAGGHQAQHQPVRPVMETDPAPERTAKWKGDRNKPRQATRRRGGGGLFAQCRDSWLSPRRVNGVPASPRTKGDSRSLKSERRKAATGTV